MSSEKQIKVDKGTERIAKEMQADKRFSSYFAPFEESSVTSFIESFARYKANLEVYGDYTKYHHERLITQYQDEAWAALKHIQMKKLFDLECLWRAEQETGLSGVEVTRDFDPIARRILDYQDISPVSEEDIERYQAFLQREQNEINYCPGYLPYSDYDDVKENYGEDSETGIDYFDFHNMQTGNHSLLLLPDIR